MQSCILHSVEFPHIYVIFHSSSLAIFAMEWTLELHVVLLLFCIALEI